MRWIACMIVVSLAACGGASEQKAATKAASVAAGQWELTSEVATFSKADAGPPAIDTPVGTRATETVCATAGRPPAELFSGAAYDCRYENYYGRNGRAAVTLTCSREGLQGNILLTAEGEFTADTLEYNRDVRTSLPGNGDVQISERVTGRRTGECTPEPAGGNASAPKAG